jgi:hypothetical protein
MSQTTEAKFSTAYEANGGKNVGAINIIAIIQALLAMFGGCTPPAKALKRWARRHPDAFMELVDTKLKGDGTFASPRDRAAAVDAAYTTFLSMPDAEIDAVR